MKSFPGILFGCVLAIPLFAEEAAHSTNATEKAVALTFPISVATITAPMVLTNGMISQYDQLDLKSSGTATISFTVTNAGNYVLKGTVNAPDESANSFYVNVDKQPEDPMMIWDFDVTSGFEERTVNWRGNGDASTDEFSPKVFSLTAGAHKVIIVGREPGAELKAISIVPEPAK